MKKINLNLLNSFINGHFCYDLKATTLANGPGIIRHIDFNDTQVMDFEKNATAEDAKDDYDSKTLIPRDSEEWNWTIYIKSE